MSALDAPVAPMSHLSSAEDRMNGYFSSKNRLSFALEQKLLASPGKDFLYSDVTPALASGVIQYATGLSLFDFANQTLFGPMDFKNQDWMHQDEAGFDNGAYGVRLRPVDMQKFGMLYLNDGCWNGKRLLSSEWVEKSFTPWIRSDLKVNHLDYGWFWWHDPEDFGWTYHIAAGHLGQRILVFPEKGLVVSFTSLFKDDHELTPVIHKMFHDYLAPAFNSGAQGKGVDAAKESLTELLRAVKNSPSRISKDEERRMIPSSENREKHRTFQAPPIYKI